MTRDSTKSNLPDTIVMKFGGSCFTDSGAFAKIKAITEHYAENRKIYVASALNGVTNLLVEVTKNADNKNAQGVFSAIKEIERRHNVIIKEIFKDKPKLTEEAEKFIKEKLAELQTVLLEIEEFGLEPYFSDYVLSFGEKLSTYLLYLYLRDDFNAQYYVGEDLIITNDEFTNALPDLHYTFNRFRNTISPLLGSATDKTIFCVTGFIGRNKIGYTTTLGRGGSDFTATILARCVYETCNNKNVRVILWKDVDGILTANPKYVESPKLVRKLDYKEAAESAFFGAKILHPKCLATIEDQKIPVEIRNFNKKPSAEEFSIISDQTEPGELKGISSIEEMAMITVSSGTLVNVPGVLGEIFSLMGKHNINVSMVAQSSSEVNTTFVVEAADGDRAVEILRNAPELKNWFTVEQRKVGILAVIGDEIHKSNHRIFSSLTKAGVDILAIAQSSDGLNVSLVIPSDQIRKSVDALNKEFTD